MDEDMAGQIESVTVVIEGMPPQTVALVSTEKGLVAASSVGKLTVTPEPAKTAAVNYGVGYCGEWTGWNSALWEVFDEDEDAVTMCRTLNMFLRSVNIPFAKTWVVPSLPAGAAPTFILNGNKPDGGVLVNKNGAPSLASTAAATPPTAPSLFDEASEVAERLRATLFRTNPAQ